MDCDFDDRSPVAERTPNRRRASLAPETADSLAEASATRTKKEKPWGEWLASFSRTHALALADQAVVSGASFATTVLVGRWTSASQLGFYAIGISLLVSLGNIQDSLVARPYAVRLRRPLGAPAEHAGNSLTLSSLLSALGLVALAATASGLWTLDAAPELIAITWALAAVAPFAWLRDFERRFAYAHLNVGEALMLDVGVAAIQLGALCWLGWAGRMSGAAAFLAISAACAPTVLAWLYFARGKFVFCTDHLRATIKQSWGLGKWFFVSQVAVSAQVYVAHWILAWIAGATATGVYAACMSVVAFANPVILGLGNTLTPRAVLALHEGGGERLWRQSVRDALLIGVVIAPFCAAVAFAGEDVMRLLYPGGAYQDNGHTLFVLAMSLLTYAVGMPPSNALAAMERPRAVVWASGAAVVLTAVLVWRLTIEWGVVGAAYGYLAGNLVGAVGRWAAFLTLICRYEPEPHSAAAPSAIGSAPDSPEVIRVLRHFTPSAEPGDWAIEQLDEGGEAHVFAARPQDRRTARQTDTALAIKLYKAEAAPNVELAHREFDSLSRLHAALAGRTINGWKISVPAPLGICESPLALVMVMVPGRKLTSCLEIGKVTAEAMESAPRAIVGAMERYWSSGQPYGELSFKNILCDIVARELSFVDPGMPTSSFACHDVAKRWYPASHDLGYLLYCAAASLKRAISDPCVRLRMDVFTEGILRAFVETIGPCDEKQSLLDEIGACARAHLRRLDWSWSLRTLWYVALRPFAYHRIDAILGKLEADLVRLDGPFETSGSIDAFPRTNHRSEG